MTIAKTLMVQGTASTVGKSTLVAGLCRLFVQAGLRVAPFKVQNMALNSFVTRDGGEIGRAQAVQAEAAGIEPTVEMNPILLKPESDSRSQVIVLGRPLATLEARAYFERRTDLIAIAGQSLHKLRAAYDLVIIEGAGSPVELNLAHYDLVNMAIARLADAPVLLVGDIDRGGIFASLLGTLMLLPPADQERVKGLIVNKFRGDLALWRPGEQLLAQKSGKPVLGTLPFLTDLRLAEEDSVALAEKAIYTGRVSQEQTETQLSIVIVRLPYLSNYDEFDVLIAEPAVHIDFVASPAEFPAKPDLIIIPGTKNTLADLGWLWRQGLAQYIRHCAQLGTAVLGICGGYQMLGERVSDPSGIEVEAGTVEPGLNLLPVESIFQALNAKVTTQSFPQLHPSARRGLFAELPEQPLQTYQIHTGKTFLAGTEGTPAFQLQPVDVENLAYTGWLSVDGWCAGAYFHGLFENAVFRQSTLAALAARCSQPFVLLEETVFDRQSEYDRLANVFRQHLDLEQLQQICNLAL